MLEIICIGNLGADSRVVDWNNGKFLSFDIAVTEYRKNDKKESIKSVKWISCTMSHSSAFEKYLKKGTKVFVRGNLKVKEWEKDGKRGIDVGMFVKDIFLL